MIKIKGYFTKFEIFLWLFSVSIISLFFILFDRTDYLSFIASLIGITSLILNAKGNPIGQILIIIFSVFYGIISYKATYYGEMITYLGMSAPMALIALISWLRHPFKGNRSQVEVNRIGIKEIPLIFIMTVSVTVGFYFILDALNTANLLTSTLSVSTTFIAVYLTFRRSPFYALAYALNDIVLIVLWIMAINENSNNLSVITCFIMFMINDLYGFINWLKIEKNQKEIL